MTPQIIEVSDGELRAARALLHDGGSNATVARRLGVSEHTVKTQLKALFAATYAGDRCALAVLVWSGRIDLVSPTCLSLRADLKRLQELEWQSRQEPES